MQIAVYAVQSDCYSRMLNGFYLLPLLLHWKIFVFSRFSCKNFIMYAMDFIL